MKKQKKANWISEQTMKIAKKRAGKPKSKKTNISKAA